MDFEKKNNIYKTVMTILITAMLTFLITAICYSNYYTCTESGLSKVLSKQITVDLDDFEDKIKLVKIYLEKYYLGEIKNSEMLEGAIKGYVEGLGDPYTEYIPAKEMQEYTENLMGNYVGIGIYMVKNVEKNVIQILSPIKESPAEEAGLLPEDIIVSVNGVKYTGDEMTTASNNIKGIEGTTVKLEILRAQEIKAFEVTRKKVILNPVESEKLENNIGYIQITSFDEGTAENFKIEFEKLKNQGITSLIIDLRNNGGGLVDETLKIADYIVPKGKDLLVTINKDKKEEIQKAEQDVLIDMEIVVLVNENSASSSEILAGALQDLDEATIIGITTYGKGVIQELLSFKDGSGLKVTTHEYYTPNRNKINGIGIQPDEIVKLPGTVENILYVEENEDTQLQKAIEILK